MTSKQVVLDYRQQAWDFLEKSRKYLSEGDLHQACEKGWGAAEHMAKAVAAARGWEYERHDQFDSLIVNARHFSRQNQLRSLANSAEKLHSNYYKRKALLHSGTIAEDLDDVAELLERLQPLTD